jgi:RHS repeat-associated protein
MEINLSGFVLRTARLMGVLLFVLILSPPDLFALGPPSAVHDARWSGNTWATANLSQKIINKGDIVTLTLKIVGGPPHGTYCNSGAWTPQGTYVVRANNPWSGGFEIIDYGPKTDDLHLVSLNPSYVRWVAVTNNTPSTEYNDHCWCRSTYWGTSKDMSGCPADFYKHGAYGPGDTFTVTLRATSTIVQDFWNSPELGEFSGNWGIGWADTAQDYYKWGGAIAVRLTAAPMSLPADGSEAQLTAEVIEPVSEVKLPRQQVQFSSQLGWVSPLTAISDSNGLAHARISSAEEGITMVGATVPGATDSAQIQFTHSDKPPVGPETELGTLKARILSGDPVHAGIGNYVYSKRLFGFPGKGMPVQFEVNYNSLDSATDGPLGFGWTHTYNVKLTASEPDVTIRWGDGHQDHFRNNGAGAYAPFNCITPVKLTKPDVDSWEATLASQIKYRFDASGRLVNIADLNGNQITFTHSTHLDRVTDTAGRQIDLTYSGNRLSAISSPLKGGNTASFAYDGNGNLTGITDPRGKVLGFTYDTAHRVRTQVDAKGVTVLTNTYNATGRIIQQKDGANNITTYTASTDAGGTRVKITPPSGNAVWQYYDRAWNLTRVIDGEGKEANLVSDPHGRILSAMDKKGVNAQFLYNTDGNPTQTKDRSGASSQFGFNAQNRPTWSTDPLGNTTSMTYDANGNLTRIQNPLGYYSDITANASGLPTSVKDFRLNQWSFGYDGYGMPQTMTDPLGAQTGFAYNGAGQLTQLTLPVSGVSEQMSYDEAGNLSTLTDAFGNVTTFTYDNNGNIASRTFVPTGATTTFDYDWAARPVKITDPLGGETGYTYDADGNLKTIADPDGIIRTYEYDKANRLTAVRDPLGHRIRFAYDSNGAVTSVTNELGGTWTTTYDAEGRMVQSTDPSGGSNYTAYDAAGRVVSVTDELGHMETFQYDKADRLVSTVLPDQGVVRFMDDANGRLLVATDPLGHSWKFSYDNAGKLASKTGPDTKKENYAYDLMGRMSGKTLRDGTTISYAYDVGSRLTGVTMPGPTELGYAYDAAGNLTGITEPAGSTTMTYDKLGRRLTRTDPSGKTVAFTYTAAGRLKTMTYPGNNLVTYAYDTAGRLSTITDWKGNVTGFQYDNADRVTQITLPNGARALLTYDAAGRVLTRRHQKSDATILASYSYGYDAAGRITSVQRSQPTSGTFTDFGATYDYDPVNRILTANNNGVATTFAFDPKGNLTSKTDDGITTTYTYDALDRLTSVSDGTNTTTYTYDGAGNRLLKTYNGTTIHYLREGGMIYCTLDGAGAVQSYNIYAGSLLYSIDSAGSVRVYHGDERGSVIAITDPGQNVVQSYAYDPYGKVTGSTGSINNQFRFVGMQGVLTDDNGLYHMQARYYDPTTRRFITEDPLGLSAGLNLYGYVGGDPVNSTDPRGLQGGPDWMLAVDLNGGTEWTMSPGISWEGIDFDFPDMGYGDSIQSGARQTALKYAQEASAQGKDPQGIVMGMYRRYFSALPPEPYPKVAINPDPLAKWGGVENDPFLEHPTYGKLSPDAKWNVNYATATEANVEIMGRGGVPKSNGGSSPSFSQRWGKWIKNGFGGIGARIALQKAIVQATIRYVTTTSVGEVVAVHGVGGIAAPVVVSGVGGYLVGREIGKAKLVYDPVSGKWVSVDQGLIDVMKPAFEKSYRTYDPNLDASKSIRDWVLKETGRSYSDWLNRNPGCP